jgi:hypothetical protein
LGFLLFAVAGEPLRTRQFVGLAPLLILLFGAPHYGATLLRVYEQRGDRQHYALFSVYATAAIALLFIAGLYLPVVGAVMLTVFLSWSPWHYTGQNYGLAVMFLRRRGVSLDPQVKRLVYASFMLSYVLTILVMHEAGGSAADTLASYARPGEGRIQFLSLGIPQSVTGVLIPLVALAYVGSLIGSGALLLRRASLRDIAPAAVLAFTQALWFSVPFAFRHWRIASGIEPLDWEFRTHYFLWIAVGHAVQYLWVTTYYARGNDGWRGYTAFLGKTFLVGPALWTLPLIVFAPWALGAVSYDDGLYLVLSSAINIHHFVLDGAIWKLRDGKIASVLLRGVPLVPLVRQGDARVGKRAGATPWPRRAVWATASIGLVVAFAFYLLQIRYSVDLQRSHYRQAAATLDLLDWFGSDSARSRVLLAVNLERQGRTPAALAQLERSVALSPGPRAFGEMGRIAEKHGDWETALAAYEAGLEAAPTNLTLYNSAAAALLELGRPDRAREVLAQALALRPDHVRSLSHMQRAERMLAERAKSAEREPRP